MDKLESIVSQLTKTNKIPSNEYYIYKALLNTLKPKQACEHFDLSFEQDYKIRNYLLEKIHSDMKDKLSKHHEKFIESLLAMINVTHFPKKKSILYSISFLYDVLPPIFQNKVLELFISSNYVSIRNRAYKMLRDYWDDRYLKTVLYNWNEYDDQQCLDLILKNGPTDYLIEHYNEYIKPLKGGMLRDVYVRFYRTVPSKIEELRKIDIITYVCTLVELKKKLSYGEAKEIFVNNHLDDRVGLLIWAFGQMGLQQLIIEIIENYKDIIPHKNGPNFDY